MIRIHRLASAEIEDTFGDIHQMPYIQTAGFQEPTQQICEKERTEVSDMRKVVDCRATAILLDLPWNQRFKAIDLPRQDIEKANIHFRGAWEVLCNVWPLREHACGTTDTGSNRVKAFIRSSAATTIAKEDLRQDSATPG